MEEIRFNLAAPNLLCICVDDRQNGESSGRVYCCYSRAAESFAHEYQLLNIIEGFLNRIDYPQSSVKIRSFQEKEEKRFPRPEKVLESREVASYRGKLGTFLVHVKYPTNSELVFYKLPGQSSKRTVFFYWKKGRYISRAMEEFLKLPFS